MSVWELKVKHPEKYRGVENFYIVTTIDPKDKNAKENLKREYNGSSDFHDFKKSVKGAKCVATMNPDSADRMKGVYTKEKLKNIVASFKEGCEIEAEQCEKKSHELDGLVAYLSN
jgi:Pyruvate/2-oxoacid:ferredoxin oxidoreductase delta subunit